MAGISFPLTAASVRAFPNQHVTNISSYLGALLIMNFRPVVLFPSTAVKKIVTCLIYIVPPPPHQKDIGVSRKSFPSILKLRDRHDLDIARGVSLLPL